MKEQIWPHQIKLLDFRLVYCVVTEIQFQKEMNYDCSVRVSGAVVP